MSGCSWCEAAEAQRHRETAGYKTLPPPSLPRVKPRSLKCLRPPLSSFKKHNTEGHREQVKLLRCGLPKEGTSGGTHWARKYVSAGEGREGKEVKGYSVIWRGGGVHVHCRLLLHGCLQGGFGAINTSLSFTGRTEEQVIAHDGRDRF